MTQKLNDHLNPTSLKINQEGDNKFQVIIEADAFEGQSILKRHRLVNDILKDEISKIHAFSVDAKPPKK